MKIGVTGASGFIGSNFIRQLLSQGHCVHAITRSPASAYNNGVQLSNIFSLGELNESTRWLDVLSGLDCVVHCAGRAHVINERDHNPLSLFRIVNVEGTLRLAQQAALSGVKRFIFLSSAGVFGTDTNSRLPFTIFDQPRPIDDFAISKYEAEISLWDVSRMSGMEVVIIRPPLVYGPMVKGNFARLLSLVRYGFPMPFAALQNLRSYIGLDNLIDLIMTCVTHPDAAGKTFLASDGDDISTSDLLRLLGKIVGKPTRLFPLSLSALNMIGKVARREAEITKLASSFQVDFEYTKSILGWSPKVSLDIGLQRMIKG